MNLTPLQPLPWANKAACANTNTPDAWHPTEAQHQRRATLQAIETCQTCPVKQQCLNYAMETEGTATANTRHGIWGGLLPTERAQLATGQTITPTVPTHCRNGHEYTPRNTYYRASGQRQCLECKRASSAASYQRKKAVS